MSKMFLRILELVDSSQFISYERWLKIVEKADSETLKLILDKGFGYWKYFTREDWLGTGRAEQIRKLIQSKLDDIDAGDWWDQYFSDLL